MLERSKKLDPEQKGKAHFIQNSKLKLVSATNRRKYDMFAKHNPLKSNHANTYRVFAQTSLCPASYLEQSERLAQRQGSMIQTQAIPNANSDWHPGSFNFTGRMLGRKRHWRQILETLKSGQISR